MQRISVWKRRSLHLFLVCAVVWGLAPCVAPSAKAETTGEIAVKAAFLLNMVRFVTWPEDAFSSPDSNLVIEILGDPEFAEVARRVVDGKSVRNRLVEVRFSPDFDPASKAHVLFVGAAQRGQETELLEAVSDKPVFHIADWEGFAERGGVANFYLSESKVRFAINPERASAVGLSISSRLLRLAKIEGGGD
jgi:hypothetical protein